MADALVRELRVVIEREQELGIGAGELLERPKFTAQRLLVANLKRLLSICLLCTAIFVLL